MSYFIYQRDKNYHYVFLINLLFLFMLSTIVQALMPISLNRILAVLIVIAVGFYTYIDQSMSFHDILLFLYYGLVLISTLLTAQDKLTNFTDAVYFMSALLVLNFLQDMKVLSELQQTVDSLRPVIETIVAVCELILLVELFDRNCYQTAWGGSRYFLGFTAEQHTLASSCCLLLSLVLTSTKGHPIRGIDLLLLLLPAVCILASGARTFLVPLLICCYFYIRSHIKNRAAGFLILGITFILFVYLYFHSNMYKKIQYTLSYNPQDVLASLTSGRTNFWMADLRDFASGNLMQILFGKGFDYVYRLNFTEVGMAIWAHNDLINLLVCTGLTGMVIYCIVLFRFIRFAVKKISTGLERFLFASYILFPMLINGFYTYPHFLYSVVFLICFIGFTEKIPETNDRPKQTSKYFKEVTS